VFLFPVWIKVYCTVFESVIHLCPFSWTFLSAAWFPTFFLHFLLLCKQNFTDKSIFLTKISIWILLYALFNALTGSFFYSRLEFYRCKLENLGNGNLLHHFLLWNILLYIWSMHNILYVSIPAHRSFRIFDTQIISFVAL